MMKNQKGQALVLVLLSLAVVLTLVLYILSRSVTDILVSSKNEETTRAFSAAEAGIEQALVIGEGGSNSNIGNSAGFVSSVSGYAKGSTDFNFPVELASGDSFTTWFVDHDSNGNIVCDETHPCFAGDQMTVCWGAPGTSPSTATTPAIEVSFFYENPPGNLSGIKISREPLDPNSARAASNSFDSSPVVAGCNISGVDYAFKTIIHFNLHNIPLLGGTQTAVNEMQFARTRMFYNSDTTHPIGISVAGSTGGGTLPSQGQNIISTGTSGQSTRRISVFQGWPEPPSVFDFAIYSSTGITK